MVKSRMLMEKFPKSQKASTFFSLFKIVQTKRICLVALVWNQ